MTIETKEVRTEAEINEHLAFGWQHTEDVRRRHGPHHSTWHILARDKDMPNYLNIVRYEQDYFALKSTIETYTPMSPIIGIITFILGIIPFVIYALVKRSQKKYVEEHNAEVHKKMKEVLKEVKQFVPQKN